MKKTVMTLTLCMSVTGLAWADGTPKIQFDKTVYDFGKTSLVHQVAGTFIFTNVGDGVLTLEKPTTSCGCTVANLKTNALQPGERGELAFTLNVGPNRANLQKHITVTSNDPKNPKSDLTVQVEYIPIFDLAPPSFYLDNFRVGNSTNLSVSVNRTDGKKLVISKLEPSKPWIVAKLEAAKTNEQSGQISISVTPDGDPRRFYENVRVFTEDEKEQPVIVSVQGRLVGEVSFTPESMYWMIGPQSLENGKIREGYANQRLIVSATAPGKTITITNLTCSLKEIKLELKPLEKGRSYEVMAKLTDVPLSTITGTITFETDAPKQAKVSVPLTVNVIPTTTPVATPPIVAPQTPKSTK
jgi:hypothetical protein